MRQGGVFLEDHSRPKTNLPGSASPLPILWPGVILSCEPLHIGGRQAKPDAFVSPALALRGGVPDRLFECLRQNLAVGLNVRLDWSLPAERDINAAEADDLQQVREKRAVVFTSPGRQAPPGPGGRALCPHAPLKRRRCDGADIQGAWQRAR